MTLTLSSPVRYVPRVGPTYAKKLEKLGIITVRDLLYHIPFRYNDFSHVTPIAKLHTGMMASVNGTVKQIKNVFTKTGKKLQEGIVYDATGAITVIWFNQMYLPKIIHEGDAISLSGIVGFFGTKLAIESPEYELVSPDALHLHTGRVVPVYPETAGVSSKWLRSKIHFLLTDYLPLLTDYLPYDIRANHHIQPLDDALVSVHFPKTVAEGDHAKQRIALDELIFMQCESFEQKRIWRETKHAIPCHPFPERMNQFIHALPFTLTDNQQTAIEEIQNDLTTSIPMNRLLEGDVGSGKTVVATAAMVIAAANHQQSILMAPTQMLAQQHYQTIHTLLTPLGLTVTLRLGGSKQHHEEAPSDVVIGTHALLEEGVLFGNIGLIVIDEQQRFGVYQRSVLRGKSKLKTTPHLLTMTATPIPRTLALTKYGNLSLSTLKEMPKGRMGIKTWVVAKEKRKRAYAWIREEIQKHQTQAFIVCPFIEESETATTVRAATKEFETLKTTVYPDFPMAILHGRMKPKEKTDTLDQFRNEKTKLLVTTPVVEVGIDIPNATIMVIEGAERFGLAQLHQLRGRVGRGDKQSYCLLFTEVENPETVGRLKLLETIHNGPDLAEQDMHIRGQGDIFGSRQHGIPQVAFEALTNETLLDTSKVIVEALTQQDPTFTAFSHLRERLNESKIQDIAQD